MPSERRVPNFRAKVYQLKSDSNWEDKGTGNCVYEMVTNRFTFEIPYINSKRAF